MRMILILPAIVAGVLAHSVAVAQQGPVEQARPVKLASNPYAPYEFLIGDWYAQAGPGVIREHITWGPNQSYIQFSVYTAPANGPQHLHFQGIAVWNGRTKLLDYLFVVEPGSGVQENGTYRAEADGSIVREVEFVSATGQMGTFRQTFHKTGTDSLLTTLMRKTAKGWEPTFPGSDKIEMSRRPG